MSKHYLPARWLKTFLGVVSGVTFAWVCSAAVAPGPAGMTLAEARARISDREIPGFWVGDLQKMSNVLSHVQTGAFRPLATSPGRREICLVAFGEPELLASQANFNSAVGGKNPSAYRNKVARRKPVLFFMGPVHGHEVEGLTGLVNLMQILETGRDLRGKDQLELQSLARQCRILIIPAANPDGTARFEPRSLQGLGVDDLRFWGQGTWKDGTFCGWPESKLHHPMAGNNIGFRGCYFDDLGVNPMHDEFFAPMSVEAPAILKVAKEEAPDFAVSLHSHENNPAILRPAYVPLEVQSSVRELASQFYSLAERRSLPYSQPFAVQAENGKVPEPFNLASAVYHVSGANSFTFECPHGLTNPAACHVTCEQILDIQLTFYEALLQFALDQKKK